MDLAGAGERMVGAGAKPPVTGSLAVSVAIHLGVLCLALPWLSSAPAAIAPGGQAAVEVEIIGSDAFDQLSASEGAKALADSVAPPDEPAPLDPRLTTALDIPPPDHPAPPDAQAVMTDVAPPVMPEPAAPRFDIAEIALPSPPAAPPADVPPAPPVEIATPELPPVPVAALSDWSVPPPLTEPDPPEAPPVPEPAARPPVRDARPPAARPVRQVAKAKPERARKPAAQGRRGTGEDAADSTASLRGGGAGRASSAAGAAAFADFRGRVLAHLARHKRFPEQARLMRASGRVAVTFSFDAAGRVTQVSLASSSGHASLDQEAMAMVRRASPFPPIPPETGRVAASFTAPIRYDLPF